MQNSVNNKSVLVTGATGFVGSRLVVKMSEAGFSVIRALRRAGSVEGVVVGDIDGQTDWREALQGVDVVVHLAARVHIMDDQASDPLAEYRKTNLDGTLKLAEAAVEQGVRRFVYLSSIKVNGESADADHPFTEADTPQPQGAYAVSKWEAEQALMAFAQRSGLEVVIVRPPLVYGPGVKANFQKLMGIVAKPYPLPLASVNNRRSLLGLENLVDFIVLCVTHPEAANEVFLVADAEAPSTPELIRKIAALRGMHCRLVCFPPALLRLAGKILHKNAMVSRVCDSLVIDAAKARELLGWQPRVSLDEELQRTLIAYAEASDSQL